MKRQHKRKVSLTFPGWPMDVSGRLRVGTVCLLNGALLSVAMAAAEEDSPLQTPTAEWLIAVTVGVVCVAMLVIFTIINCTDCYKSEVSTECHPASATGAPKWGGAGGYSGATTSGVYDPVLGAGFTGEVINLQDMTSHPLPYALVPSEVPEAQGFRGYGPVETAGSAGVGGYGSTGAYQPSQAAYGGSSSLVGYGSSSFGGYGGSNVPSSYGGGNSSLAGYGDGSVGYGSSAGPPTSGYGGTGGTQSSISNAPARQTSLTGYGATGVQPSAARPTQGGTAQGEGRNTGGGGSSRPLPGAHVPLMTPEPEEPPPPYFAASR